MTHEPSFDDGRPNFDHAFAQDLVGKIVLVGITVNDKRGEFRRQEQFFGRVMAADPVIGFTLELHGARLGQTKVLPPATGAFSRAPPGTYRLRETDEVVVDPDYTSVWTLTQPDA